MAHPQPRSGLNTYGVSNDEHHFLYPVRYFITLGVTEISILKILILTF
jgi:hypothetical protein